MISMARTFGAPTRVPAGKVAANRSNASMPGANLAVHAAHDMHDVAVALDHAVGIDAHRPGGRHPAQIVARQIDQHDVLGVLLGIGEQDPLELQIPVAIGAARARARDGAKLRVAAVGLHQRLGRRAHHRDVAELAEEHVRRGIEQPQRPIDLEGRERVASLEARGEHQLIHIAARRCTPARASRGPRARSSASEGVAGENRPGASSAGTAPRSARMTSRRRLCRSASLPSCRSAALRVR